MSFSNSNLSYSDVPGHVSSKEIKILTNEEKVQAENIDNNIKTNFTYTLRSNEISIKFSDGSQKLSKLEHYCSILRWGNDPSTGIWEKLTQGVTLKSLFF